MAVEVDHVIRPAIGVRLAERLGQPVERRRPQHVQLQQLAILLGDRLDQPAGDGAERYVAILPRPADHQQHADRQFVAAGGQRHLPGLGVRPDELAGVNRQRRFRMRLAEQFPGDGRGVLNFRDGLDADRAELLANAAPQELAVRRREQGVEQLFADRADAGLDAVGDLSLSGSNGDSR